MCFEILKTSIKRDVWQLLREIRILMAGAYMHLCVHASTCDGLKQRNSIYTHTYTYLLQLIHLHQFWIFCICSTGGLILDYAVARYHGIAVFSPVMNGTFPA